MGSQKRDRKKEQIDLKFSAQKNPEQGLKAHLETIQSSLPNQPVVKQIVCSNDEQTIYVWLEREGHTCADVVVPTFATLTSPVFRTVDRFPMSKECNGFRDRVFQLKLTAPIGP